MITLLLSPKVSYSIMSTQTTQVTLIESLVFARFLGLSFNTEDITVPSQDGTFHIKNLNRHCF